MAQERLSMRKVLEVLRLKRECGLSNRAISRSCGIAASTVSDYAQRAAAAGLTWPVSGELDEDQVFRLLFPSPARATGRAIPVPDWVQLHTELRRKGVTLRLLWLEYREAHPDGYGYSQFCELYRHWAKTLNPPMRLSHKGGEELFVDYAGQTVPVVEVETGEIHPAQVFVAVLGASSYTYAEAHWHQDLPSWIGAHVRAFSFFGGVPELLVPDNLKAGVRSPCRYEPDLNPTYLDLAQHYQTVVIPARVRKPRDKAKVEVGVQVVERWILARLRNQTFFGLADLNRAIRRLLDDLNGRPMRHLGRSRRELFVALDQPALRPLPETPYCLATWKKARVSLDYHVELDHHYYSAPYSLIHQEVFLRATESTLEVFHKHRRVASHPRSRIRGQFTTLPEHMPAAHRAYGEWSPERFLRWAQDIGPNTQRLVASVLASRQHPQQAFRSCLGILRLGSRYGQARLEAACGHGLAAGIATYKGLRNILEARLDQVKDEPAPPFVPTSHALIRGEGYYH